MKEKRKKGKKERPKFQTLSKNKLKLDHELKYIK